MIVAENPFPLCQTLLIQRQRLVVFGFALEQGRKIIEKFKRVRMVVA
jgi:hypothetical protein